MPFTIPWKLPTLQFHSYNIDSECESMRQTRHSLHPSIHSYVAKFRKSSIAVILHRANFNLPVWYKNQKQHSQKKLACTNICLTTMMGFFIPPIPIFAVSAFSYEFSPRVIYLFIYLFFNLPKHKSRIQGNITVRGVRKKRFEAGVELFRVHFAISGWKKQKTHRTRGLSFHICNSVSRTRNNHSGT